MLLFATSAGTCVQNFDFEISSSHNPGDPPSQKKMVFIKYPSHQVYSFFSVVSTLLNLNAQDYYVFPCNSSGVAILVGLHFDHICVQVLGVLYIFESLKT